MIRVVPTVTALAALVCAGALAWRLPGVRWSRHGRHLGIRRSLDRPGAVAVTFDDGPEPGTTDAVLSVLRENGTRATFFLSGEQVAAHPELARAIVDAGHEVASHGHRHRSHIRWTPWAIHRDLRTACDIIECATGVRPVRFRPPYGEASLMTFITARLLGMEVVLWTADGNDWVPEADARSIARQCDQRLEEGGIVLLHDASRYNDRADQAATAHALVLLLDRIDARGLRVESLAPELRPVGA